MTNGLRALREYVATHPDIEILVGDRVYIGRFPPERVNESGERVQDVPRPSIVIRGTSGTADARLDTIIRQPIEIVCIDKSDETAMDLSLEVCQVLKDLDRVTVGDVLLHCLQIATGAAQSRNGETGWPECIRTAVLSYDEREVA